MRDRMFDMLESLKTNSKNKIIFYENNKRVEKSFQDFSYDIDIFLSKIFKIKPDCKSIALVGPVSYEWMVIDYACIKSGIISIAIPESLHEKDILAVLKEYEPNLVLCDSSLKDNFTHKNDFYYFRNKREGQENNFDSIDASLYKIENNRILEVYSVAFSSGTSEKLKSFKLFFRSKQRLNPFRELLRKIFFYFSFWSSRNNKVIIFMPFSHWQQRSFVQTSLMLGYNIILSDPINCVKHIIIEKPNIMVSVPIIYETIGKYIKQKINSFKGAKNTLFNLFNSWGINKHPNWSPIKKLFSFYLFKDIRKLYGGKADYFITGSAPIDIETLTIFFKVGVKILQAYGQSELGVISMNSHGNFKIGSVGKPKEKIKINEDSEILVKFIEDKHKQSKDCLIIDDEGYIHTGDTGYIDNDGYLFLTGRKDDIIVLPNGKKIYPNQVEKDLISYTNAQEVLLVERNNKISAILSGTNVKLENSQRAILNLNKVLPEYSKIESFCIVPSFTIEDGLLTTTLKVKRKAVINKYKDFEFLNVE